MIGIFQTARDLQAFCDLQGWLSCFIGGIAVLRWGEPRVTRDVDLTLLTGFGEQTGYIDKLLGAYEPRIGDARAFALRNRVLLVRDGDSVGIDISLGGLPFEEQLVSRASLFEFEPGLRLRTCSADDLVVMKLFASRPLDVRDAETVVWRNSGELDWPYIETHLRSLADLKGDPDILRNLARLRSGG